MSATAEYKCTECQLATFHVGELLLAMPIENVREINRNLDTTPIPHAPGHVRGVINLRGEVVTVIDLGHVLGFGPAEATTFSRNLIIRADDESIGLWVDRISDIITIEEENISPTPANIGGAESRCFKGVYRVNDNIVVILDIAEVLAN